MQARLASAAAVCAFVIIPRYGDGGANQRVVLCAIGSYLISILVLQLLGTYRGLKSFSEKLKHVDDVRERYRPQRAEWNLGSLVAVALLLYEAVQLAMFASHTINASITTTASSSSRMHSATEYNEYLALVLQLSYVSLDFVGAHQLQLY